MKNVMLLINLLKKIYNIYYKFIILLLWNKKYDYNMILIQLL